MLLMVHVYFTMGAATVSPGVDPSPLSATRYLGKSPELSYTWYVSLAVGGGYGLLGSSTGTNAPKLSVMIE